MRRDSNEQIGLADARDCAEALHQTVIAKGGFEEFLGNERMPNGGRRRKSKGLFVSVAQRKARMKKLWVARKKAKKTAKKR